MAAATRDAREPAIRSEVQAELRRVLVAVWLQSFASELALHTWW